MESHELAWRLCVSSHHGLTLPPRQIPCLYHKQRARDALAVTPPSVPPAGEPREG